MQIIVILHACPMAYYKTRNTGTRNRGTRNTGGTPEHPGTVAEQLNITLPGTPAEHSRIPTEYRRNTSGTSRNNGIIQNEEQLQYF